jgi:hypothetical protein
MKRDEFERAYRELVREWEARSDNQGCVACTACERCTDSTFCARSKQLVRCHYCVDSERSFDCTHCHASRELVGCNHCRASSRCARSSYLERCIECSDCTYCFGCVGLSGREFCILNQPYERSVYFQMTAALAKAIS